MAPTFILLAVAISVAAGPALAAAPYVGSAGPYYVARRPYTTRCTIVRTVPDGRNLFQVGKAHPTLESARRVEATAVDCVTKRRAGSR
ncbi:hypothetical protein [Rhizobium sp. RAF56]|jgi:hypothetical protein|uniref:hypothetical protein n=1 Tax=Rhizobium sp. RAF56 TaxID=3233062 RepID=UPI003F9865E8